jgi:hypothetical protein
MLKREFGKLAAGLRAAGAPHVPQQAQRTAAAPVILAPGWEMLAPSGDTSGAEDTAAITAALAGLPPGGMLSLAAGVFHTSGPIVPGPGQHLAGRHGAAPGGDGAAQDYGTVIKPVASWSSTHAVAGVISYPAPQCQGDLTDLWIDCRAAPAGVDGVAACGGANAVSVRNVGVYAATGHGFAQYPNRSVTVDGWHLSFCLAQGCGADGFYGAYTDATLVDCHAQSCHGDGFSIHGGNAKLIGCRGDLCTNGFTLDVPAGGGYNDATVLTGCGTQRNANNGLNVVNTSADGAADRAPVLVDGCSFGGDGTARAAGTAGAGIGVRGRNIVIIGSATVTVGTVDVSGGCPDYGLLTEAAGAAVPILVAMGTGLLNGAVAPHRDGAPAARFSLGPGVYGATGYRPAGVGSP